MNLIELEGIVINSDCIESIGKAQEQAFGIYLVSGKTVVVRCGTPERTVETRDRLIKHLTHRRIESF